LTATNQPLVSIAPLICNEERFTDATLASLRKQDYPVMEILVLDNASVDRTVESCQRHAAEDARICIKPQLPIAAMLTILHSHLRFVDGA
jgi:glycosyltransferase involved in cell wall biosynthesis